MIDSCLSCEILVNTRTKFLCVILLTNKEILALFYRVKPATEMKRSVIEGTTHVRKRRRSKMGEIDVSVVLGWHGHRLQIVALNCAIWQVLKKIQAFDTLIFIGKFVLLSNKRSAGMHNIFHKKYFQIPCRKQNNILQ